MEAASEVTTVIDANSLVLGRMASIIARRLLLGEHIIVVNAEKAVFSGRKTSKVREAKEFLEVGGVGRGPFHYRRPDRIVRKTIKGMLPVKQAKGIQAYKRLCTFIGVPENLKNQKMETLTDAQASKLSCPHFTVGEFAEEIGWRKGGKYAR